jgi:hypothetical protein
LPFVPPASVTCSGCERRHQPLIRGSPAPQTRFLKRQRRQFWCDSSSLMSLYRATSPLAPPRLCEPPRSLRENIGSRKKRRDRQRPQILGINAGAGGYTIDVRGATNLTGAVIASTAADPARNTLTTGTLTASDITNTESYRASSVGFSGGISGVGLSRAPGTTPRGTAGSSNHSSSNQLINHRPTQRP